MSPGCSSLTSSPMWNNARPGDDHSHLLVGVLVPIHHAVDGQIDNGDLHLIAGIGGDGDIPENNVMSAFRWLTESIGS